MWQKGYTYCYTNSTVPNNVYFGKTSPYRANDKKGIDNVLIVTVVIYKTYGNKKGETQ